MKMFATIIVFCDIFRTEVKFSRWGKNLLDRVKIHQVGKGDNKMCSDFVTCDHKKTSRNMD